MESTISSSAFSFGVSGRDSYGKLRYLHKEVEKDFVAWVKARSPLLQKFNRTKIWLQTLEREFHLIKEPLPHSIVDELAVIVEAREKAKAIHVAKGSHDEGHENCLQMYKCILRKARQQEAPPTPPSPSPPPPATTSEDEFPPIGSTSPLPPKRRVSTKRPYSTILPPPTAPAVLRTGSVKKQRLVLKPRSTPNHSTVAAC